MSNPYTGQVDLRIGETDAKLEFDWRAISAFQSKFGKDKGVDDLSLLEVAETIKIGLEKHNPDISLDDIMDESIPLAVATDKILEAFIYAQHGPDRGKEIISELVEEAQEIEKKSKTK